MIDPNVEAKILEFVGEYKDDIAERGKLLMDIIYGPSGPLGSAIMLGGAVGNLLSNLAKQHPEEVQRFAEVLCQCASIEAKLHGVNIGFVIARPEGT